MTVIVSCMQNDFFEVVGKYALQSVFCSLWCMCSHPAAGDQVVWPRQEHHTVAWWPLMIISGCNSGTGIAVVNQTLMLIPLQKRHFHWRRHWALYDSWHPELECLFGWSITFWRVWWRSDKGIYGHTGIEGYISDCCNLFLRGEESWTSCTRLGFTDKESFYQRAAFRLGLWTLPVSCLLSSYELVM